MKRKNFLRNISALSLAGFLSPGAVTAGSTDDSRKKLSFRLAFMSDVHIKPTETAEIGMRKAFKHVNAIKPKPDLIMNGGDAVMDALAADKINTQLQWDIWNRILAEENRLPMQHCIGNHDIWGWQLKDEVVKTDPLYAKNWVIEQHKMPGRYYSFTGNNWYFIVLDSVQENNGGYIARIDEEQFTWLENELKQVKKDAFICIISHIPIISFCSALFREKNEENNDWKISRALLHVDTRRLKALFRQYPNIKTCLSGHIHLQDEVEYLGIKYFCNGAVSGNWWGGAFQEFDPAYAIFDFYKDGTVERQMICYGNS